MRRRKYTKLENRLLKKIQQEIINLNLNQQDINFINSITNLNDISLDQMNRLLQLLHLLISESSFVYIFKSNGEHTLKKIGNNIVIDNKDTISRQLILNTYKLLVSLNTKVKIDISSNNLIRNVYFSTILSKKFNLIHINTKSNG